MVVCNGLQSFGQLKDVKDVAGHGRESTAYSTSGKSLRQYPPMGGSAIFVAHRRCSEPAFLTHLLQRWTLLF